MISYELAKKLKDAGLDTFLRWDRVWIDREGNLHTMSDNKFPEDSIELSMGGWMPIPTLSELIEACPQIIPFSEPPYNYGYDGLFTLSVSEGKWRAGYELVDGWYEGGEGHGSTPEEAVANLWIELNKKT